MVYIDVIIKFRAIIAQKWKAEISVYLPIPHIPNFTLDRHHQKVTQTWHYKLEISSCCVPFELWQHDYRSSHQREQLTIYPWTEQGGLTREAHDLLKPKGPNGQILAPGLHGLHGDYNRKVLIIIVTRSWYLSKVAWYIILQAILHWNTLKMHTFLTCPTLKCNITFQMRGSLFWLFSVWFHVKLWSHFFLNFIDNHQTIVSRVNNSKTSLSNGVQSCTLWTPHVPSIK